MFGTVLFLLLAVAIAYTLHRYRDKWINQTQIYSETTPFAGEYYQLENTDIIKRPGPEHCDTTVICFPGFMENQHYFMELYQDEPVEFIAVNNADYFSGFVADTQIKQYQNTYQPEWGQHNPYPVGTIEHDAHLLGQVIEHLATGSRVIVHGHSRGGAVLLETGRQHPRLTANITAVLEAPVLPQARINPTMERMLRSGGHYLFPLWMALLRRAPGLNIVSEKAYGPLTPRKRELLEKSHLFPKHYRTALLNMKNIREWQRRSGYSVYDHYKEIRIVMPEKDSILCRHAMNASATQRGHVKIIETRGTDHFISVEQPETMKKALGLSPA
ncbi:hypothetical protein OLMES_0226 [Oleiphilus messinensis]|uniref:AB hydrolase-1 domain-containing protein n=1 Tax=Oleiphilus messinensis TaxID=141451 RepID=A0A1Y0I1L0_9GAMM|nr:alpha/beta hydrolase [Oleiphilus messinensis]ARU54332.1 hypothetical protein OLMES_0226 [Oleiphilus messinensis]